jgi:hypothetical protein
MTIIWPKGHVPPEQITALSFAWLAPGTTINEAIAQIGIAPEHEAHARELWARWTEKAAAEAREGNA